MIDLLTLATASFIGGCVGGTAAAVLIDKAQITKLATLGRRVARIEGYEGAAVSKVNVADMAEMENQIMSAGMAIMADPNLTLEEKKKKGIELAKLAAQTNPDMVKKVGFKLAERFGVI